MQYKSMKSLKLLNLENLLNNIPKMENINKTLNITNKFIISTKKL